MDNALIVDGVLAVILLAGALIGAKRGLFKSLMGLVVIVAAFVGAVLLADMFTDPITDALAPGIVDSLTESFSGVLEKKTEQSVQTERGKLADQLERYGVVGETAAKLLAPLEQNVEKLTQSAKEQAVDAFRATLEPAVRTLVRGAVHTELTLALCMLLLIVLKLLVRALNLVFDLPVLSTANALGGALLGLAETALLLFLAVDIAARFGAQAIVAHADDTLLLPLFLNHSPVELISNL